MHTTPADSPPVATATRSVPAPVPAARPSSVQFTTPCDNAPVASIGQHVRCTWQQRGHLVTWYGCLVRKDGKKRGAPDEVDYTIEEFPPLHFAPTVNAKNQPTVLGGKWPPAVPATVTLISDDDFHKARVSAIPHPDPPSDTAARKAIAGEERRAFQQITRAFQQGPKPAPIKRIVPRPAPTTAPLPVTTNPVVPVTASPAPSATATVAPLPPVPVTTNADIARAIVAAPAPAPVTRLGQVSSVDAAAAAALPEDDDDLDVLFEHSPDEPTQPPPASDPDRPENLLEDLADQVYTLSHRHFQSGSINPPGAAALKVDDVLKLLDLPPARVPTLTTKGLMTSTSQEHRRILRALTDDMPIDLMGQPAPIALVEFVQRRAKERQWRCSSLLKTLATLQGALSNLPMYRATQVSVHLGTSPIWRMAMRAAAKAARIEMPNQPRAIAWHQVKKALQLEPSLPIFAATLLTWVAAARSGCVLQLAKADLTWIDEQTLSIRFRRGKGASLRNTTYTVHTVIPPDFAPRLRRWIDARTSWLFPSQLKSFDVTRCLRRIDVAFECRSLRRGALQHLASLPQITDEILLLFSGHSNTNTLRRYLNFGVKATHTRKAMVPHAAQLCA